MNKKILGLSIGVGVMAAAAGTSVGLYVSHHEEGNQTKSDIMASLTEKMNSLPNVSTIVTADELEENVKNLIEDTSNNINTMHQAVVEILEDRLTESRSATETYIDGHITTTQDLFKGELDKHRNVLDEQMDQLSSGIVGDHDLNYYKDILDETVASSQFDELYNTVDSLDTDLNSRIDNLSADLTQNKTDILNITTGMNTYITATTGKLDEIGASIDNVKTATLAAITKVETDTSANLQNLKDEITNNSNEIKRLFTESAAATNEINSLKFGIAETIKKVDQNTLTINDMQIAHSLLVETNANIKTDIEDLSNLIVKVNALSQGNTTEINDIKAKVKDFDTKYNALNTSITTLTNNFDKLTARVVKNEEDIKVLFTMIKNTDATVNAHIEEVLKHMVNTDATLQSIQNHINIKSNTFDKAILLNSNNIDAINTELATIKTETGTIKTNVDNIQQEIQNFDKGIKAINNTIASILQDIDDISKVADQQELKVLGLEGRLAILEANANNSASEIIYKTDSANLLNLVNDFHFTKEIVTYKQLQILYHDAHAGRYGSFIINIDQDQEITAYSGGGRLHPNRSWWSIQVDYPNKTMRTAFYFTAGNASWAWHSNARAISIKQIIGLK